MLASDFQKKIKRLNPRLRIYCGDNPDRPAGLYIVRNGEYEELCGVDKNYINEWPTYDKYGKMIRGGWHRVLQLLIGKKLISREYSYKLFGNWSLHREPVFTAEQRDVDRAISQLQKSPVAYRTVQNPLVDDKEDLITVPVYDNDDVYDIGQMVKKDQRQAPAAFTESGANLEV